MIFVNPSACLAIIIIIINVIITTIQERVSSTSSSTFATFATLSHYFYPLTLSADKGRRGGLHCWSESAQIEFVIGINYLRGISTPFCHLQLSCQVSVARSSLFTFHPPPTTLLTHSVAIKRPIYNRNNDDEASLGGISMPGASAKLPPEHLFEKPLHLKGCFATTQDEWPIVIHLFAKMCFSTEAEE